MSKANKGGRGCTSEFEPRQGDYHLKKNKLTTDTDKKKTKWQQPGDKGRPPLWAKEYDWY